MTNSEREVVAALGQTIAKRIGEKRYDLWFAKNTKLSWDDDHLIVHVPNRFFQEWLQSTFTEDVRAAASTVLGRAMQVRFVIDAELFQAFRKAQDDAASRSETAQPEKQTATQSPAGSSRDHCHDLQTAAAKAHAPRSLRRWHRLADFVVGPCNRVAHASALSVVESPCEGANPLVLHGSVGTGKTHLLEGIYAGLRKNYPDWQVRYATSEDFTNRFVQAMRLGKLGGFRRCFRECDVLLIDDLHFLARKPATQEEFLHTLDALLANNKQLVLACDCHPRLADEFSPELVDRLVGGAVWGLAQPDIETRFDILRAKAGPGEPHFPNAVLRFLAEQLRGNVRELEGAIQSIRHYSTVAGRAVDVKLAREALGDLLRHAIRVLQLSDVERAVCSVLRLESRALQAKDRIWAVSHPRMLAMFLARKCTGASYSEIGRHFGGRNHATVVAAEKKVRQWLKQDGELQLGERRLRIRDVLDLVERELSR